MALAPPPWQVSLARLEGALPFLPETLAECLALASLRRLWHAHVQAYPFENIGLEHDAGADSIELTRSWHTQERTAMLSWLTRVGPPVLARGASRALAAKGARRGGDGAWTTADRALARLDTLLPSRDPVATLRTWITALREEDSAFLEGGSELVTFGGRAFSRFAPRGSAWAASLAAAVRPQLLGLGQAPFVLAGLTPRILFRSELDMPLDSLIEQSLTHALDQAARDLTRLHQALRTADRALAGLYASSQAPASWRLIVALGPLTRAELGRALGVTARTASQAATVLQESGLCRLRSGDHALVPIDGSLVPNC